MPIPFIPTNLFTRPFADSGQRATIPDVKPSSGRASLTEGFPQETQLPLSQGGVAPNRLDFNGMFNMLSAFGFWQQSGGLFKYLTTLNYDTPAIVVHNSMLWWCRKQNGPESVAGLRAPGAAPDYWQDLFTKILNDFAGGGSGGGTTDPATAIGGNPVGTYIHYHGTIAPDGYFACDGSSFSATTYPRLYQVLGSAILPDMRGYFLRGLGGNSVGLGIAQGDAIRNITASHYYGLDGDNPSPPPALGAFSYGPMVSDAWNGTLMNSNIYNKWRPLIFDASDVVPTANENRPVNKSVLICIRHD